MILFFYCAPLVPASAETPQEMTQLARNYLLKHLDPQLHNPIVALTPLSATAQTPTCQHAPHIRWNSGQKTGNINLSLICTQPKWQRYLNAKISGELPVVITNKDIPLGASITPADVNLTWLPDAQVKHTHLHNIADINNISARQFIGAGTALSNNQIRASQLIKKGDQVRIIVSTDQVAIEMLGIALESGEKGKQIRVQNQSSGKIIKGNILSADSILVP